LLESSFYLVPAKVIVTLESVASAAGVKIDSVSPATKDCAAPAVVAN